MIILKVALGIVLAWIIIQVIKAIKEITIMYRKKKDLYKIVDLRRDEDK